MKQTELYRLYVAQDNVLETLRHIKDYGYRMYLLEELQEINECIRDCEDTILYIEQ